MTLTSHADIASRISESAFNTVINQIMLQRPDLFNYGTKALRDGSKFCNPISYSPLTQQLGFELSTELDKVSLIPLSLIHI